jgi:acyl-coenzyme A thioesterase PaaI-like protein
LQSRVSGERKTAESSTPAVIFKKTLEELRKRFHSRCIFNGNTIARGLNLVFADDGSLNAVFICGEQHQGYDAKVHGGVIAAIIDASMAQCLMGHGMVGYTTDLSIRYWKPLAVGKRARLKTVITKTEAKGLLVSLKTGIEQNRFTAIRATGRFFISDAITP